MLEFDLFIPSSKFTIDGVRVGRNIWKQEVEFSYAICNVNGKIIYLHFTFWKKSELFLQLIYEDYLFKYKGVTNNALGVIEEIKKS